MAGERERESERDGKEKYEDVRYDANIVEDDEYNDIGNYK